MNHAFNFKKIVALLLAVIMMISMCGIAEDSAVEIHDHDHAQLESIMASVLESIEETEEETSEEPAEETEEESTEEPAGETEEESTEEPAEETEEESTEEPVEETEEESTEEPEEETEEESTEEPVEETEEEFVENIDTVVDVPVAMPMMLAVYNAADIGGECEHNFENGVCTLCGYESSCKHETTWIDTSERNPDYIPVDAQKHNYIYDLWRITYCGSCAAVMSEELVESGVIVEEKHNVSSGSAYCSYCDYELTCAHEETTYYEKCIRVDDITRTETQHSYVNVYEVAYICNACGVTIVPDENYITRTETEDHSWEDGICTVCEYFCEHTGYTDYACTFCGMACIHSYTDGVCANCGHNCEHTEKYISDCDYYWVIETTTPTHHVGEQWCRETESCPTCGKNFQGSNYVVDSGEFYHNYQTNDSGEVVCTECGVCRGECYHNSRVNEVVEWTDYTVDEIEYNDETHDVYGNKIVTYDCVDCGTTGIIEDCGRTYGQMPHDLDNGKCTECEFFTEEGHVCVPVEDNYTSGVLEVVSKGAEGHTVTYQTCIRTYCEHGGAYLTISQEYVTEEPVTEPHVFSNSAIECDRCDYRNECAHENSSTESENTEYAYSDSLGHFVHSYSIEKCNDCGARVEHTAVEVEPHNNDDDECVCGFDGNCDHVDKEEYFEEDYEIYTCKDGLCYRTGPIFKYSGKCSDCGVSLTWISDDYEEKQVEHMLSTSGICFNCGWQDPDVCEHANRYYVCEFMDYDGKFVDNGDGTHSVGAQLLYRAYCPECDTDLGDKWHYSDFDADYVEEHHWNRDSETLLSKCICGAKSDEFCDHAETYEVIEYDYDDEVDKPCATPNGAAGHISSVSGTKMISKFCRECFALVGEEEIIPFNTAEEQAHRFTEDWLYEENYCTYCTECHYVCTHDNATFEPNGFYIRERVELNNDRHVLIVSDYLKGDCPDCGQYVEKTSDDEYEVNESHDWEDDICKVCKWKLNCAHENADSYTDYYHDWENPDFIVGRNDEGHEVVCKEVVITDCDDCGMHSEEVVGSTTRVENHSWNPEGTCDLCAWENSCDHTNEKDVCERVPVETVSSVDNKQHKWSGVLMQVTTCHDCEQVIGMEEIDPNYERYEDHIFNVDGFCIICDHETDCTADHYNLEPTEYKINGEPLGYRMNDDAEQHMVIGMYTGYGKCEACGMMIALCDEEMEMPEAHSFDWNRGADWHVWYDEDGKAEATPIDGGNHEVKMVEVEFYECSKCNQWAEIPTENYENQTHGHDWVSGVCETCGYEPDCEHPEENVVTWEEFEHKETIMLDADNADYAAKHSKMGDIYEYSQCENCGAVLSKDLVEADAEQLEAHVISSEGTCFDCGYLPECDHPEVEVSEYELENAYAYRAEEGADQHYIIGEYAAYGNCDECGLKVFMGYEDHEVAEDHSFESNHGSAWHVWYDEDGKAEATVIDGDNHEVKMVEVEFYECSKCYQWAEIPTENYDVWTFGHDWVSGVCETCGYEPDCEHPEENIEIWEEFEIEESGLLEESDADYAFKHYEKGDIYEYSRCEDCGAVLSKDLVEEDVINYKDHTIGEDGVCRECPYSSDCDHPEVEASEYVLHEVYDYRVDEGTDQHYVIGKYQVYGTCDECKLKVFLGFEDREEQEDHSFDWHHGGDWHVWLDESGKPEAEAIDGDIHNVKMVWKNTFECSMCNLWADIPTEEYEVQEHGHDWESGVCVTCGYEPDCDHAGAVDVWEEFERYEHGALEDGHPDRAILHYEKGNEYKYTRCTICNAIIDKELINEAVVNYDNHIFNVHGTCNFCDYQSECTVDHETLDYSEPRTELLECWYIGSEKVHHARYEDIYEATCPECEMTFEYERQEWETEEEPHVKEGDPVESYFVYATEDEDFVIDCNADEHTVKLVWIDEYSCPMCNGGLFVYDNSKTDTEIQHHQWDENGVCEICGYENACEHGDTVVEREEHEHSRVPVAGGKQHKITYDIVDVTYCNICWQNVGEEPVEVNSTKLENHQLDENGWCSCNFLSECDHSNLPYEPVEGAIHRIDCIDDETHEVEYDEIMAATCPECGLEVVASCETKVKQVAHVRSELWEEGWHHAYEHADFLLDYDEYEHTVKYVMKQVWWCEDCGQSFLCETEEWEYVTEGHGFNTDGTCHACPYINPCEHAKDVESLVEFWEHGMEQVDDKQHVRIGNKVRIERCNECWQNLVEEVIEENAEVFENHEFDAENVCRHCGYETTCDHSNLEYAPVIEDYQVWHESDEGHRVVYIQAQVAECSACGMKVYKSREEVDELLPHAVTEVLYGDWDSYHGVEDEDFLKYVDEEVHTIKQYEWAEIYCEVCDCNYWGYSGETRYDTWNHEWQPDGTCHWCGYVNTCKHDGGVGYFEEFYDHTMTAQDEKQHVYMGELVREARCIYCWQVLESTVLEEEHKVFEDHDVTQENFCGHCGYEFDCDHSAIQLTEKHLENEWSDAIDEDTHVHFTEYRMRGLCDKCDLYVYGEYFVEEKEEKHNLDLENLNKYSEQADPFVTEIGKNSHTIRYIEYTGAFCMDCGMYTEKPFEQGETILVEQHYYENGKCMVCGYANTCEHKNTVTVESFNANDCVSVDGKEHVFKGNICKETWCDDCYSLIASEVLKAHEEKAVHELDRNGACVDCDFFVICDHGALELPNKNESIMAFYLEDEKTHYYEVWCYSTGECSVCGFTVQGDGYVEGRYADHEFDQNGKCVDCGYVKPAADPTPKPTAKPTVKPTAKPTATPAPSVEPTEEVIAEPTPEVSAEPSVEPTVECVVEPGTRMAEALVTVMDHKTTSEDENVVVEVKIVNSEVLMDEEQHETFETLSSVDQMMVLMKVLQYDGEADYAENNLDVVMSEEAQALVETILESFNAMEEEEKVQYMAVLAEAFPTSEVEIDGEIREAVVIVLEVKVDDVVTYEQYTFLRDAETGSWLFYSVELVEKPEDFDASEVAALPESEQAEVAETAEVQG